MLANLNHPAAAEDLPADLQPRWKEVVAYWDERSEAWSTVVSQASWDSQRAADAALARGEISPDEYARRKTQIFAKEDQDKQDVAVRTAGFPSRRGAAEAMRAHQEAREAAEAAARGVWLALVEDLEARAEREEDRRAQALAAAAAPATAKGARTPARRAAPAPREQVAAAQAQIPARRGRRPGADPGPAWPPSRIGVQSRLGMRQPRRGGPRGRRGPHLSPKVAGDRWALAGSAVRLMKPAGIVVPSVAPATNGRKMRGCYARR